MAAHWNGFSEEDISKMKTGGERMKPVHHKIQEDPPTCFSSKEVESDPKEGLRLEKRSENSQMTINNVSQPRPTKARKQSAEICEKNRSVIPENKKCSQDSTLKQSQASESCDYLSNDSKSQKDVSEFQNKSLTAKLVLSAVTESPTIATNLNDFKAKHKLMEEQNRARKVFLAKALEDRKKQTHAEQLRLGMIQEELQKLDQRLSCDVSIVRNQIEAASLEFMEAQKRYDRAEKEFLDAKLLLYTKLERKELLTHHLCTIIEQNEMRKAQKLSELMEKLQMPERDSTQSHENGTKEPATPQVEEKRKISSEIILTPTSVVSNTDGGK